MAVVPICYKMYYKDQTLSIPKEIMQNKGCFWNYTVNQEVSGGFFPVSSHASRREPVYNADDILMKANTKRGIDTSLGVLQSRDSTPFAIKNEAFVLSRRTNPKRHLVSISRNPSERERLCTVPHAMESNSTEKHLRSLDSYFEKLKNDESQPSSSSLNSVDLHNRSGQSGEEKGLVGDYIGKLLGNSGQFKAKEELGSLDEYLSKVNEDTKSRNLVSSASGDETTTASPYSVKKGSGIQMKKQNNYLESETKDDQRGPKNSYDETSGLYLISIVASINIGVFLFEIASPIRNSELGLFSLPSLYGAKINHLILIGEWWRLVTPMFLHSGIFHVALGCWVLLTFGPQVCRAYGSFTFFLIYILGGISGNLTSFLHTPDPTVGGTGPAFAIIGAWLIYQYQNRDVIGKDAFESMFQKAIAATAFGFILSSLGPIDDWSHFGAAFTGIAYGFLTCPTLGMDNASSETGQEEGITLVRRYVDPCKSLTFFSIFVLVLSSLLFIIEPPLSSLVVDTLV